MSGITQVLARKYSEVNAGKKEKPLLDRINDQDGKQMTKSDLVKLIALAKKLASEMQKWAPDDWEIIFKGNEIPE
jgi:hypothetical protein